MTLNINKQVIFFTLFISAIPLTVVTAASDNEQKKAPDDVRKANAVLTVNTIKPKKEQWAITQSANGSIWAWQDAIIASEIGGLRITNLYVDIGSEVKRGQKLAQLSQAIVKVDITQKQAMVAQAKAELKEAKANAKRVTEAKGGNAFSEQQSTQYLIASDKATANLASAKAQLENQKIRLKQTEILAVDDGIISSRSATLGAVVQVGTELFRQVRQNRLEWRAELMAEQLLQIKTGQKVKLAISENKEIEGVVRVKSPTLNPLTRKAFVYVDLPENTRVIPGMFMHGKIILGQKKALTVPESAVVLRDGYSYVFEVDIEQRVQQRKVETGHRKNKRVEILNGLNETANIVSTGGAFLNGGDTVRIEEINPAFSGKNMMNGIDELDGITAQ